MKKILVLLFSAGILWGCGDGESKKSEKPALPDTHQHEAASLSLNHGEKWKSDESTRKNVAELEGIAQRFNENKDKSLSGFKAVAGELQTGLDKMIKECRMQGADHDALHLWLEPLLKDVNALKKAASETEASKLFNEVSGRITIFHQYFD